MSPVYGRTAKGRLPDRRPLSSFRRDGCIGIGIGTGTGSPRRPARRSSHSPYDAFAKATDEASTGRAGSRIQSFMLPAYRYSLL